MDEDVKEVKKTVKKKRKKRVVHVANHKRIQFARLYFASKEKNAPEAYIAAGYSAKWADSNASKMLLHPEVTAEFARLGKKQEKRLNFTADDILRELLSSAKSDIRELFDDDGFVKNPKDWPDSIAKSVSSIKIEEIKEWNAEKRVHENVGFNKHVKLWDKTKSLELLGKHLKLFQDAIQLNITADALAEAMEKGNQRTKDNG